MKLKQKKAHTTIKNNDDTRKKKNFNQTTKTEIKIDEMKKECRNHEKL